MFDIQWDEWMVQICVGCFMYMVNKFCQVMKQIINDQCQNWLQVKVRVVEDSDVDFVEICQGLICNIDQISEVDRVCDIVFQFVVGGGYGVWWVNYGYEDDSGFDMVIWKEEIFNLYIVVFDFVVKVKDCCDVCYVFVDSLWVCFFFCVKWLDVELVLVDDCSENNCDWF